MGGKGAFLFFCLAISLLAWTSHAQGGFAASCSQIRMSGGTLLANCKNTAGNGVDTRLDLNAHLANIDGYLQPAANGKFIASCSVLRISGQLLVAQCKRRNGSTVTNYYGLNAHVANYNGNLAWVG